MSSENITLGIGYKLQWEESQKTMVLLFPEGMVKLNPSSAEILHLCNGKMNRDEIVSSIQDKYQEEDISNDILEFLRVANDEGWIQFS